MPQTLSLTKRGPKGEFTAHKWIDSGSRPTERYLVDGHQYPIPPFLASSPSVTKKDWLNLIIWDSEIEGLFWGQENKKFRGHYGVWWRGQIPQVDYPMCPEYTLKADVFLTKIKKPESKAVVIEYEDVPEGMEHFKTLEDRALNAKTRFMIGEIKWKAHFPVGHTAEKNPNPQIVRHLVLE